MPSKKSWLLSPPFPEFKWRFSFHDCIAAKGISTIA
jgi:hypothetical protein